MVKIKSLGWGLLVILVVFQSVGAAAAAVPAKKPAPIAKPVASLVSSRKSPVKKAAKKPAARARIASRAGRAHKRTDRACAVVDGNLQLNALIAAVTSDNLVDAGKVLVALRGTGKLSELVNSASKQHLCTPLQAAVKKGNYAMMMLLVGAGAREEVAPAANASIPGLNTTSPAAMVDQKYRKLHGPGVHKPVDGKKSVAGKKAAGRGHRGHAFAHRGALSRAIADKPVVTRGAKSPAKPVAPVATQPPSTAAVVAVAAADSDEGSDDSDSDDDSDAAWRGRVV